ncbi:MAG TPA: hypothetical protein VN602_06265 [Gemmatimonadaceae bacterium]|nr:hypothetical protein [Gemmatimonadaceae bacterium]
MKNTSLLGSRAGFAALALSLALSLAATLTACGADSAITAPDTTGQFSAVVSTGSQISLTGQAGLLSLPAARSDTTAPPPSAILILQDKKTSAQMGFQWVGTALPAAGTYSVGAGDLDVAVAFVDSAGAVFDGVGGSVTLSTVSNGHVTGSFSVTAQPSDSTAQTATISGNFNALVVVQ